MKKKLLVLIEDDFEIMGNGLAWNRQGLEDGGKIIGVISFEETVSLLYIIHWRL